METTTNITYKRKNLDYLWKKKEIDYKNDETLLYGIHEDSSTLESSVIDMGCKFESDGDKHTRIRTQEYVIDVLEKYRGHKFYRKIMKGQHGYKKIMKDAYFWFQSISFK